MHIQQWKRERKNPLGIVYTTEEETIFFSGKWWVSYMYINMKTKQSFKKMEPLVMVRVRVRVSAKGVGFCNHSFIIFLYHNLSVCMQYARGHPILISSR